MSGKLRNDIFEALARGYTHETTSKLVLDPMLIEAMADELCKIFHDGDVPEEMKQESNFPMDLENLINKYSIENGSDTADFILAEYLMSCLQAFERATNERDRLAGRGKISGSREIET